jgi:hypothetical protein
VVICFSGRELGELMGAEFFGTVLLAADVTGDKLHKLRYERRPRPS